MSRLRVVLSVSDSHLDVFPRVVDAARAAGLVIDRELSDIGILTGSIDPSRMADLSKVAGVESVEPDRDVGVLGAPVA